MRPPLSVTELIQLTHLCIPLQEITWFRVTMSSDQWICCRHTLPDHSINMERTLDSRNRVTVITMLDPHQRMHHRTFKAAADSAQMNPSKPIIAVKAGSNFQIYDMINQKCLNRCSLPYTVKFWAWIDSSTIAVVSDSTVYHWYFDEGQTLPIKIFNRDVKLANTQLAHYVPHASMKWFALCGLEAEGSIVIGMTQIYSVNHDLSQYIEAHVVCFTSYQFKGNAQSSNVLVAATRSAADSKGKLHVVELGPHRSGNLAHTSHSGPINFQSQWHRYDFPSSIQVSVSLGLVYVVTKYGCLHLCDLETCAALCSVQLCSDVIFTSALNSETDGIITISRNGQVLAVDLKEEVLVNYVWEVAKKLHIAQRLSSVLRKERRIHMF